VTGEKKMSWKGRWEEKRKKNDKQFKRKEENKIR